MTQEERKAYRKKYQEDHKEERKAYRKKYQEEKRKAQLQPRINLNLNGISAKDHPDHLIYKRWQRMKTVCNYKKDIAFKYIGGAGITICSEWEELNSFIRWCKDNNFTEESRVIRLDNSKNFSPENCKLVTLEEYKEYISLFKRDAYLNKTKIYESRKYYGKFSVWSKKGKFLGHYDTYSQALEVLKIYDSSEEK